jgi:nucleoside 2-deoxyribosyltransferase
MKIYLAGPLFKAAEREFNTKLATLLRQQGHQVFLPQEMEQRDKTARDIFNKDVEGIDWADVVVANMDGPDPDSGTSWECGYAYKKKPIIVFRTDFRAGDEPNKAPYNLMLTESSTVAIQIPFADSESLALRIGEVLRSVSLRNESKTCA